MTKVILYPLQLETRSILFKAFPSKSVLAPKTALSLTGEGIAIPTTQNTLPQMPWRVCAERA